MWAYTIKHATLDKSWAKGFGGERGNSICTFMEKIMKHGRDLKVLEYVKGRRGK